MLIAPTVWAQVIKTKNMQKCLNKFVFIFGFIIVIFFSCLNKSFDNKNKTLTMVKVEKDTLRLINKSNYNKFIGKSGNIKVVEINVDFYSSIKYRQELYNQKIPTLKEAGNLWQIQAGKLFSVFLYCLDFRLRKSVLRVMFRLDSI